MLKSSTSHEYDVHSHPATNSTKILYDGLRSGVVKRVRVLSCNPVVNDHHTTDARSQADVNIRIRVTPSTRPKRHSKNAFTVHVLFLGLRND